MPNYVGLDFETYGAVNLPKHGLHRYVNGPHFRPLLAAVARAEHYQSRTLYKRTVFDFVEDHWNELNRLRWTLDGTMIVAHNAGFEQAVLGHMGIHIPSNRFVDSAVLARAAGAGGSLEAAAPQLLGVDKMAVGKDLIQLFSIPGKYQEANGDEAFDPLIKADHPEEWARFGEYCSVDAELSLRLAFNHAVTQRELANQAVTMDMNITGWNVDMDAVRNMHLRYQINVAQTEQDFRTLTGAKDLNLNSTPQLQAWCAARGVRATSFDEAHVTRLLKSIERKLTSPTFVPSKVQGYEEVRAMLHTKQAMGGSSLKKLQTIIDMVGTDGRLHDQYLHIGAGASYRTTGRGVQMQNLKRLNGVGDEMADLYADDVEWDNGRLASNLRQVFTASDPGGQLIVGDFSSVESRGLAWQANENWKLKAYAEGRPVYEEQAGLMFGKPASLVTKSERQLGKVGELSCGYQAGPEAVQGFAEKMGLSLSEVEAAKLVKDWRTNNPMTVDYWERLNEALHMALLSNVFQSVRLPHGKIRILPMPAPQSLRDQVGDQDLRSLVIKMVLNDLAPVLDRVIHGTRIVGRNIQYFKPRERKTGDLWVDHFTNPKTKQVQKYTVYGGKLAGLLTQSLCREIFFESLQEVHARVARWDNVQLVGQFHDEIVLDWAPGGVSLTTTMGVLELAMTSTTLPGFPLAAEIHSSYRYVK